MAKCKELIRKCRKCQRYFWRGDDTNPCPSCGERRECTHDPVQGYDYCNVHGGPSPKRGFYGLGRPIVTGASSKFPLTAIAGKALEQRSDGRLLSNRNAIDIIDQRILQLAGRIDLDEAPERMAALYKLWNEYKELLAIGKDTEATLTKHQIDDAFEKAYHDYAAWNQMMDVLDLRRKHIESEVRVLKDIKAILTAEDANELTAKLFAANIAALNAMVVSNEIRVKLLKRIEYEFRRIIGDLSPDSSPESVWDAEERGGETDL